MAENATTTDERSMRRARRQALIDAGVNPYPIASEVTAHAGELEELGVEVALRVGHGWQLGSRSVTLAPLFTKTRGVSWAVSH